MRIERVLVLITAGAAAFIAVEAVRTRAAVSADAPLAPPPPPDPPDPPTPPAPSASSAPRDPAVTVISSGLSAPERDPARIAWTLRSRGEGTYIAELLSARDSLNFRWPDRRHEPMRIWVQEPESGRAGYDDAYPQLVRDAFNTWGDAGVPIFFSFVRDSARCEIRVTWVDRFQERITGRTRWAHDQHDWIVGGSIQLALHQPDGAPLTRDAVRAIALHEVGHLVGLDHTEDAASVMAARVRVAELSEADRLTARLVYSLPPGSLRGAAAGAVPASSSPPRGAPSATPPASR